MFQDLKNPRTVLEPVASSSRKRLKTNQPKIFSYPRKKIGKKRGKFFALLVQSRISESLAGCHAMLLFAVSCKIGALERNAY